MRQEITFRQFAIAGSAIAGLTYILILLFNVMDQKEAKAVSCLISYMLNWSDPSTYTVTCGSVNPGGWSVKGTTCSYFSPVLSVGGVPGDRDRIVDIIARINQSGNLDGNDTAFVYYYINGSVSYTDIFLGGGAPAVFTSSRTLTIPASKTFQISIKLKNDKSNELWQIKDGDVNACVHVFTPLPVSFNSFAAEVINENTVRINWSTASETNNDYFTIERSKDGKQFEELPRVKGSGNSSTIKSYSLKDSHPYSGTSYYRLKQTDFNGKSETFKTIPVSLNEISGIKGPVHISPNPFNKSFTAKFESLAKEQVTLQLVNTSGKIIFSEIIMAEEGINLYRYQSAEILNSGTYTFRISSKKNILANAKIICKKN